MSFSRLPEPKSQTPGTVCQADAQCVGHLLRRVVKWQILIVATVLLGITGCAESNQEDFDDIAAVSALDRMVVAFDGSHSREAIRERLDKAMTLYDMPITEENYSVAGRTLVALRKEDGVSEMDILAYMIRSRPDEVKIDFSAAASLASVFLAMGAA